jgi:ABC-type uncharacterized transport system permease subunit
VWNIRSVSGEKKSRVNWITPLAAVVVALALGALLMLIQGSSPVKAYEALFQQAFGSWFGIGQTLSKATPLILSGLAVTVGLRAGLFNIGAQGQLVSGALAAAWAGYAIHGLRHGIHLLIALLFGVFFGAVMGWIAGALKAYRGVHEVISTIMLNSIVLALVDYLASGPFKEKGQSLTQTPPILPSARFPSFLGLPHGFLIALILSVFIWWLFRRTTTGFRLETVGQNKNAAWYAGISIKRSILLAMTIGGAIAGLGGAIETLGITGRFEPSFNAGLGFDGITIALLGRANPLGVIPGAILIGGMRVGAAKMQFEAGVAPDIVDLIMALMLFFVTAPLLTRWAKGHRHSPTRVTGGWVS